MASLAAAFAANEDFSLYTIANHDHITRLPIEVKAHVIQHLSIGDLGRLAQTSAFFKDSITPIMYKRDNKEECPRAIFWAASVDPAGVYNEDVMTVLDLVIRYGGDLNKTYGSGAPRSFHATPLHLAAARGNLDVVKKLLNYGADPNALGQGFLYKMKPSLDHGKMRSAHEAGNINILHILASQKDREYRDPTGLSYFRRYSNLVNAPVPRGAAPLSMAMRHSNFNLIRDIIANGGDIEAVSEVGTTPLIQAITCFNKGKTREIRKEYMELIHYLVKSCNAGVGRHSDARVLQTPLTCAAMGFTNDLQYITWKNGIKDISSIINLLLDHGADVNERSDQGCSLLGAL
ncbi:putative ankyrin repeat protein, partial [Trichoderma atroviride IMI 206040]